MTVFELEIIFLRNYFREHKATFKEKAEETVDRGNRIIRKI